LEIINYFKKTKSKVMKECLIIGVDVSKSTLDIFTKPAGTAMRITNNRQGFKKWFNMFKKQCSSHTGVLVIMEHTGRYSYLFELFLRSKKIGYCKIAALQIKRSLGMIRGKNDKVDAERIADYGWLRRDILTADEYRVETITELRSILSLRLKFVRDRSGYITRLKEMKASGAANHSYEIRIQQQAIEFFTGNINRLNKKIRALITSDSNLGNTCELLRSIKGIGWIIAANMIGYTDNFKRFGNARKFNCYAGIAPFRHESGSSIKGKARVSHLANKEMKTLLNLAAFSAIQHDNEIKMYYRRRISEGKHKMSCLNMIRAKLVARMFAVVKRQTPYQEFTQAA
jgi:transposase